MFEEFDAAEFSGLLPLFPLPNVVFFPGGCLPLHIFEPRYRRMLADARAGEGCLGMTLLRPGWETDYAGAPPIHDIGCLGRIRRHAARADGTHDILLQGLARFRVEDIVSADPYRTARVSLVDDEYPASGLESLQGLWREILDRLGRFMSLQGVEAGQWERLRDSDAPPGRMCDILVAALVNDAAERQRFLEDVRVDRRIARLDRFVRSLQEVLSTLGRRRRQEPGRFPPELSPN